MKKYLHLLLTLSLVFSGAALFGGNSNFNSNKSSSEKSLVYSINSVLNEEPPLADHPNQYFVKFCPRTNQVIIKATLSKSNSADVWKNEKSDLRLIAVKSLPYSHEDGEVIAIAKHVKTIKKKSEVAKVLVRHKHL